MLQIFKAGENVQAHPSKPIQLDLVKNTPDLITLSMELSKEMQTKCILKFICHNHHFFSKIHRDETIRMKYTILRADKYFQRYLGSKLSF